MKMADLMCVELNLVIACSKCKASVAVNGPREVSRCAECDADSPHAGRLRWRDLLTVRNPPVDVFKILAPAKDGTAETGSRDGVTLTAVRGWPRCPCGRQFEGVKLAGAFAAERDAVACPTCAKQITIQRAPDSFRAEAPSVVAVAGAEPIPDWPPRAHLPRQAAGKTPRSWCAMFDRSRA